jgi:hypothetical protein
MEVRSRWNEGTPRFLIATLAVERAPVLTVGIAKLSGRMS